MGGKRTENIPLIQAIGCDNLNDVNMEFWTEG